MIIEKNTTKNKQKKTKKTKKKKKQKKKHTHTHTHTQTQYFKVSLFIELSCMNCSADDQFVNA